VAAETDVAVSGKTKSTKSQQIALYFNEEPYTYSDVLVAGALRGEWAKLAARVRAKRQPADREGGPALTSEAAGEIVGFRRLHRLEAASDLRDWLAERDLRNDDLLRYVRGETGGWWPEAVFSGCFARWADALERWLTVRYMLGSGPGEPEPGNSPAEAIEASGVLDVACGTSERRAEALARAFGNYESWAASAISEGEIERLVGRRKIGWTRLEYDELIFTSDSAVAEAYACVAEDGESVEEVAARAGVPMTARSDWQERLPAQVGSLLLALDTGQVGVPGAAGGPPELLRLRLALSPSAADERIRKRARTELLRAVLTTAGAGRTRRAGAW
jgi:transposase-like protein